jgi:uncharacterized protein YjbJ (UPF0337 family)
MNSDRAEGKWKQMKGALKEKWGKLTDDDLKIIEGNRDQLVGRVQERYGMAKDEAHKQVEEWRRTQRDYDDDTVDLDRDLNRRAS